ncbi:MAG: AMP-binding protein, partial [Chloroflexota bacterium]
MPNRPASIPQAFLDACARTPDKVCLRFEGRRYSYGQFLALATRWTAALRGWGLQPGDRVGLFLENSPTFLAAYLGTHLAGGTIVPVNTQYRQVELRHILADAGMRLCVTDAPRLVELQRVQPGLPALELVVMAAEASEGVIRPPSFRLASADSFLADVGADQGDCTPTAPSPDAVALIAYTSGTTGRSKGAMLTHGNLAANSAAVTTAWRWTADDELLLTLPLFHV